MDRFVRQQSKPGKQPWTRSPVLARHGHADIFEWRRYQGDLLRLSLGQQSYPLRERTGCGDGVSSEAREQAMGNRVEIRALLGGSSLHECDTHIHLYELFVVIDCARERS